MPTETELAEARQEILNSVTEELSVLRQEALGLTEQSQIDAVIEVIDFWVSVLKKYTDYAQLLEGCGRPSPMSPMCWQRKSMDGRVPRPMRYLTSRNEN